MATFTSFKIGTRVRRTGTKTKCTTNPLEYGTVVEQDQDGGEKIKAKADHPGVKWNKQDHRNFEIVTSASFVTKGTRVRKLGTNPPKYGTVIEDQDGKGGIKVKADEPGVVWNTQKQADNEFGSWPTEKKNKKKPPNVDPFAGVKVSKCQSPKIKVNVRVDGEKWEDIQQYLRKVVRDGNLSEKYRKFTDVTCDYYLRNTTERRLRQSVQERDEAGQKLTIDVDHTFECQLLAFSILNAKSCTKKNGVLGEMDIAKPLTGQLIHVQNFLKPIFSVQNDVTALKKGSGDAKDCLNLRLLNSVVNKVKGDVVKKWIKAAKQPGHEVSFGTLLQRGFENSSAMQVLELGVEPGKLVTMFERELRDLQKGFTAALKTGMAADAGQQKGSSRKQQLVEQKR